MSPLTHFKVKSELGEGLHFSRMLRFSHTEKRKDVSIQMKSNACWPQTSSVTSLTLTSDLEKCAC